MFILCSYCLLHTFQLYTYELLYLVCKCNATCGNADAVGRNLAGLAHIPFPNYTIAGKVIF